jgi:hypothetical protein
MDVKEAAGLASGDPSPQGSGGKILRSKATVIKQNESTQNEKRPSPRVQEGPQH